MFVVVSKKIFVLKIWEEVVLVDLFVNDVVVKVMVVFM